MKADPSKQILESLQKNQEFLIVGEKCSSMGAILWLSRFWGGNFQGRDFCRSK